MFTFGQRDALWLPVSLSVCILFSTNLTSGFSLQICTCQQNRVTERQWEITGQTHNLSVPVFFNGLFNAPHTSSEVTKEQHKWRSAAHVFGSRSLEIPRSSPPRQQHRCGG
ncbi:hypothetical protein DdX_17426 [Ditylenchus destructor]|uniref:Secreted protein n=1 Tax=Ditylenchus destructor TaxID=166010 RepID=A0AAD4MRG0_9BILA|nr:hypothetical protein DdX_17426 [Ditylenchus destructor]